MEKKRIWIVTELFHPEETATAFIFTRIANFLSNKYEVCVISGPEFYDNNKVDYKDNYQLSKGIKVIRVNTFGFDKNSMIQRSLKFVFLSFQMSFLIIKKISKGEVVLLATNPAPLLLLMNLIRKWKKIQLHILVHDVFPENTVPAQIFKTNKSLVYRFIKALFDSAYSKADHLIVIGSDMKEMLMRKTLKNSKSPFISIVPNWTNPSIILPNFDKFSGLEIEGKSKIVLQYAGNIGRVQGLDVLIDAFIKSKNREIHLILRGTGALYSEIENLILSKKIRNISLLGSYSRNEENEVLSNCHISVVSLSAGMLGLGVPSKTYNLLSAGNPILFIGEPKSEVSLLVKEHDIGWSIDINEKNKLISFFKGLNNENLIDFYNKGKRARVLAENEYNERNVLKTLQFQMEKLINK